MSINDHYLEDGEGVLNISLEFTGKDLLRGFIVYTLLGLIYLSIYLVGTRLAGFNDSSMYATALVVGSYFNKLLTIIKGRVEHYV